MKFFATILCAFLFAQCSNKTTGTNNCYKAKLEIKGICMNYTLRLLDGSMDTSMVVQQWTDEHTGKSYSNIFALANPCAFPQSINEGDEFYFTLENTPSDDCAVCQAYYPTPPKRLAIRVLSKPCK